MKIEQHEVVRSPLGREQLVALAREAGFARYMTDGEINWKMFERFAALVAEATKEKAAKIAEQNESWEAVERVAEAIRSMK